MNQRDLAFASLWQRIYRAAVTPEPRMLLDEMALGDACQLLTATDPGTDIPAAHVLGWFRWLRYLALPEQDARQELSDALSLLGPVFGRNPYAVPEPLQRWYLQAEASSYFSRHLPSSPGWFASQQEPWLGAHRLPVFQAAVRSTLNAAPADESHRVRFLLDTALMLRSIAERAGDEAILAEVAQVTIAALGSGPPDVSPLADLESPAPLNAFLESVAGPARAEQVAESLRLPSRVPPAISSTDNGGTATVESATGVYDVPGGDRPGWSPRRRRDREGRSDSTGILRLRRDRSEDIWPDDSISDEDYWASVAADRPLGTGPSVDGHSTSAAASRLGADPQAGTAGVDSRFAADQRGTIGGAGPHPRLESRPSFQPSSYQSASDSAVRRPDRDNRSDRTKRVEQGNASGAPDLRASDWRQTPGLTGSSSPPTGRGPSGMSAGAWTSMPYGMPEPGRGNGDPAQIPDQNEAERRQAGGYAADRDSSREMGGSTWSVRAWGTAHTRGDDDPLTSTTYSRSALTEDDGRPYRVPTRRSQAEVDSFIAENRRQGGYQNYSAGSSQPAAAALASGYEQRTGGGYSVDPELAAPAMQAAGAAYPFSPVQPAEPVRHLWAQLPERVGAGKRIPLLVWISTVGGSGTSRPLKPFQVPSEGRRIIVAVSAPGFELSTDADQELLVPSSGDSEPIRFGLHAVTPGLHRVRADAFASGTFLGRVELQVSVEIGSALSEAIPRKMELSRVTGQPGEVTLQVNRENGAYSFQLTGTSWYQRVLTRSLTADPTEIVERILAELRAMARGESGFTSPGAIREHIKNLGTRLWSDIVPDAVRRQFWEQADNIGSLVVMSNLDTVPWELLNPVDRDSPDLGFLAEHVPVVRRVYERTPAYSLPLPSAAYVMPPQSPSDAAAEISDLQKIMGTRVRDLGVVSRLEALQELFAAPPGVLHFACHNTFSPIAGSVVRMDGGPVRPDDLEQCKRRETMAAASPLVFFNACRTAGEIQGFTQMSGWASQFMAAGAGAFIGTLWPVRTKTAREFATSFYDALIHQNSTLGEASLYARKSVSHDLEDPTWLAYTVYGSPAARVAD